MKTSSLKILLAGIAILGLISCYHPQSDLIVPPGQQTIDENVLEISFALPNVGPTEGGMPIAVLGKYFHPGTQVFLDGVVCTNINIVSTGYIQCFIPAHAAGVVDVRVDDPVTALTVTLVGGFTYSTRPFLTGLTPAQGTATGGTAVHVNGFNFQTGATVTFGVTSGVGTTFQTSRLIDCTTPPGTIGQTTVTVTNPDLQTSTLNPGFTYMAPPPNPMSIAPVTGDNMGGTAVTITGDWFQLGAGVKFGANNATNIVVVDAQHITCTSPFGPVYVPAQGVDIIVTNPDMQMGVLPLAFTYFYSNPAPTVISVNPTSGPAAGGTPVTITGTGFIIGATVRFSLSLAPNVAVTSPTTITCTSPAGSGTVGVTVTNPDTQFDTLNPGFTFVGGGGGGSPGNWIPSFNLDMAANCDWWYLDFYHHSALYEAALTTGGIFTNGAAATVDLLSRDKLGGQILETSSVSYQRNTNGTGISGASFNICFIGDPSKLASYTLLTDFSRICYGNTDPSSSGALGRAIVDNNNSGMEDDCINSTLGIFVGELIGAWSRLNPGLALADQTYLDGTYVVGTGNDTRYNQIQNYFQQLGMREGFVNAHEIGHSVGLLHCSSGKCIMNSALSISGTFTNTWYYFCSAHKTQLGTNLGYTPLFARETMALRDLSKRAAVVARGVVTHAGPFLPWEGNPGVSELRLASVSCLKGAAPETLRIMADMAQADLPPTGTEVLVFLGIPDTGEMHSLAGYYVLRAGDAGCVALDPVLNPDAAEYLASAEVYSDFASTPAAEVSRLVADFRSGGRLAADAVVALSGFEGAGLLMTDADRKAFIDAFSSEEALDGFGQVRMHFAILMGRLGDSRAIPALAAYLDSSMSYGEEKNVADALCGIDKAAATAFLSASLPGAESGPLARKIQVLGFMKASDANARIMAYMASADSGVRAQAIIAAGRTGSDASAAALKAVLDGAASAADKKLAVVALGYIAGGKGFPIIREACSGSADEAVRAFAADYLRDPAGVRFGLIGGE